MFTLVEGLGIQGPPAEPHLQPTRALKSCFFPQVCALQFCLFGVLLEREGCPGPFLPCGHPHVLEPFPGLDRPWMSGDPVISRWTELVTGRVFSSLSSVLKGMKAGVLCECVPEALQS